MHLIFPCLQGKAELPPRKKPRLQEWTQRARAASTALLEKSPNLPLDSLPQRLPNINLSMIQQISKPQISQLPLPSWFPLGRIKIEPTNQEDSLQQKSERSRVDRKIKREKELEEAEKQALLDMRSKVIHFPQMKLCQALDC